MEPAPVGSGPYLPFWQMSPVLPFKTLLNLNVLMHPINTGSYDDVLRTGKAAVGVVTYLKGGHLGDSDVVWQTMVPQDSTVTILATTLPIQSGFLIPRL
jgi:hypothetical protein